MDHLVGGNNLDAVRVIGVNAGEDLFQVHDVNLSLGGLLLRAFNDRFYYLLCLAQVVILGGYRQVDRVLLVG